MKIFLTGATGLLGFNLAKYLTESGYKVVALTRRPNALLSATVHKAVIGNILDTSTLLAAMKGCTIIIHAAADTNHLSIQQNKTNLKLTQQMLEAARSILIDKFIYVSTANTIGYGSMERPGTETTPFNKKSLASNYIQSKWEAEQLVLQEVQKYGFPAVIMNPTFMLGPNDLKPSSGQMILGLAKQKILFYPKGGKNVIHVKDVCVAIKNGINKGKIGERYILGNQNLYYSELFAMIAEAAQKKCFQLPISGKILKTVAHFEELKFHWFNRTPMIDTPGAQIALQTHFYDATKARQQLGLLQTPVKEAVNEAYQWLLKNRAA